MRHLKLLLFFVLSSTRAGLAAPAHCESLLLSEATLGVHIQYPRFQTNNHCFVFLPGLDRNQKHWKPVVDLMREDQLKGGEPHCLVTIDLLGQGSQTRGITPHSIITIESQVHALEKALITHFPANTEFTLVAHSYSSLVATALAQSSTSLAFRKLILLSPYVDQTEAHHPRVGAFFDLSRGIAMTMGLEQVFEDGVQMGSMASGAPIWNIHRASNKVEATLEQVMALTRGARLISMKKLARQLTEVPVHVVHGRIDEVISRRAHYELYRTFQEGNSRVYWHQILSNHDMINEHPHKVADFLLAHDDAEE